MKKNRKRKYPFPQPDEKRNKELRDARITDRPGVINNIPDTHSTISQYNRKVENEARKAFRQTQKTREQLQFIEDLPKFKAGKEASVKATIEKLTSKPINKWTPQETEAYQEFSPKLQRQIDKKRKKRFGI